MNQRIRLHPEHPAARPLSQAAERLSAGELAVLPSDAGYLFAWMLDSHAAEGRLVRLRRLDSRHLFTLLCRHLSEIGSLARLSDPAFRLVKSLIPGPYTFVLPTGAGLPKRLKQTRRKAIGCRIPDHAVTRGILEILGMPLVSASLVLPSESLSNAQLSGQRLPRRMLAGEKLDNHDSEQVAGTVLKHVDFMLDAGDCQPGPTSVVDLTGAEPTVIRPGWKPLVLG